jgi:hypothetical protein
MKRTVALIVVAAGVAVLMDACHSARAATDVVLMYGWGPNGWSAGIDQIARKARTLRGVGATWVGDYRATQSAYQFLMSRPHEHSLICVGYSCGGNSALLTCGSVNRPTHVIMLQPSVWCGRYGTTHQMHVQDTWSSGNFGLGSYQPEPVPAQYTTFIQRDHYHGAADTDPLYQRDALTAIGAVADPSRRAARQRYLQRTAPNVDRQDATVIWRRE